MIKKEDILYPIEWEKTVLNYIYNEIFIDEIYKKCYDIKDNDIIADFGANIGLFSLYALEKANVEKIYMVEPFLINYDYMIRNMIHNKRNNLHKCIFIKAGISEDGYKFISDGDIGNKLDIGTEITKTLSFMTFINYYNVDKIDVLKIDIEGSEILMFNDDTFNWIFNNNVDRIMGEMHPIEKYGEDIFNILNKLVNNGYEIQLFSVDGYDIKDNIMKNKVLNNGIKSWDYYRQFLFYAKKIQNI